MNTNDKRRLRMDEFENKHMNKWLDTLFQRPRFRVERDQLEKDLVELTNEYPELLKTHSWPEMHRLVIRKYEEKVKVIS
jgi:hypothetical protein